MLAMLKKFVKNEEGLETVEYGIIAALIVVGTIVAIGSIGVKVSQAFSDLDGKLP